MLYQQGLSHLGCVGSNTDGFPGGLKDQQQRPQLSVEEADREKLEVSHLGVLRAALDSG